MSFKISDEKQLKTYTKIWEKLRLILNIKFDSEPIFGDNDKYSNVKMKIYDGNFKVKKYQKKMHHISVYY